MFYVSVSKEVLRKVEQHAKSRPEEEVLGFLIGRMEDQAPNVLIVEDAISGETISERYRVTMPKETIAKIADDIITGRIKGNVVGWYHSHPGLGLFLSDYDIATQAKLQQFSPYIVALVIDPKRDEVSFFTLNMRTKASIPIRDDNVHIFSPGEDPIPSEWLTRAPPPSMIEGPPPIVPPEGRIPEKAPKTQFYIIIVSLIAALIITSLFTGLYFLRSPAIPAISHSPITSSMYGRPIEVNATVTDKDGIKSVILYFSVSSYISTISKSKIMDYNITDGFANTTIEKEYVTGDIAYYIKAIDKENFENSTEQYLIRVSDFDLVFDPETKTIETQPRSSKSISIALNPLYGFDTNVEISLYHRIWPLDYDSIVLTFQSTGENSTNLSSETPVETLNIEVKDDCEDGEYVFIARAHASNGLEHYYEFLIIVRKE